MQHMDKTPSQKSMLVAFDRKVTSVFDFPHVWGVFKPFYEHTYNECFITTWGIADTNVMDFLVKHLKAHAKSIRLIVGYDKEHHNMVELRNKLLEYLKQGWRVRVMPGMHIKVWAFDAHAYVGSCNFVPSTIHNYMHPTTFASLQELLTYYWMKANVFDKTTKLKLIPATIKYQP